MGIFPICKITFLPKIYFLKLFLVFGREQLVWRGARALCAKKFRGHLKMNGIFALSAFKKPILSFVSRVRPFWRSFGSFLFLSNIEKKGNFIGHAEQIFFVIRRFGLVSCERNRFLFVVFMPARGIMCGTFLLLELTPTIGVIEVIWLVWRNLSCGFKWQILWIFGV